MGDRRRSGGSGGCGRCETRFVHSDDDGSESSIGLPDALNDDALRRVLLTEAANADIGTSDAHTLSSTRSSAI